MAITERVIPVCAATLVVAYTEHRFWYVPVDVIAFTQELGMAIADPLGSRANVREVLEMLKIIEATRLELLPNGW